MKTSIDLLDASNVSAVDTLSTKELIEQVELSFSLRSDSGISALQIDSKFTNDFSDGKLDGENNFEPVAYQWSNLDYRKGYLIGMAKRIGIGYTLVHNAKTSKVIVVD